MGSQDNTSIKFGIFYTFVGWILTFDSEDINNRSVLSYYIHQQQKGETLGKVALSGLGDTS